MLKDGSRNTSEILITKFQVILDFCIVFLFRHHHHPIEKLFSVSISRKTLIEHD